MIITVALTDEQAEILLAAFKNGELKEHGFVEVREVFARGTDDSSTSEEDQESKTKPEEKLTAFEKAKRAAIEAGRHFYKINVIDVALTRRELPRGSKIEGRVFGHTADGMLVDIGLAKPVLLEYAWMPPGMKAEASKYLFKEAIVVWVLRVKKRDITLTAIPPKDWTDEMIGKPDDTGYARAVIRLVFDVTIHPVNATCFITKGTLRQNAPINITRMGVLIQPPADTKIIVKHIRFNNQYVEQLVEGHECEVMITGAEIQCGDVIEIIDTTFGAENH